MMHPGFLFLAGIALLVGGELQAANTATPVGAANLGKAPYKYTGLIGSGDGYQGSGAVVRNPKVVLSCAHLFYDDAFLNPWVTGNYWYRAYYKSGYPETGGQLLRGYYYLTTYQTRIDSYGQNDERTFAVDFTAQFSYVDLSGGVGAAPYLLDGVAAFESGRSKLITGYPGGIYRAGDPREYLMHQTGPFTRPLERFYLNYPYVEATGIATGSGNSGGPAWVYDNGAYRFAGVLVAGLEKAEGDGVDLAGVKAMDAAAWSIYASAVAATADAKPPVVTLTSAPTTTRIAATPFAGKASDNLFLKAVQIRSKRGSGAFSAWKNATLAGPSERVKTWKATAATPVAGTYTVQFRAVDGNNYSAPISRTVTR